MLASIVLIPSIVLLLSSGSRGQRDEGENEVPEIRAFKSVVKYLGTDFVMYDGCSLPKCQDTSPACFEARQKTASEYFNCQNSEDGKIVACLTDILPNHTNITIPVFATMCSAQCYLRDDPKKLRRIHFCPYSGTKQHVDPNTQRLF